MREPTVATGTARARRRSIRRRAAATCLTIALASLFWLTVPPRPARGQVDVSASDHHAWARFGVGSWKKVRIYRETFDPDGNLDATSTHETKTTLTEVNDGVYTLRVEVVVEVAGRRFQAEPQTVQRGFNGETVGQNVTITALGNTDLQIGGEKIPTEVRQIIIDGDNSQTVSKVYVSRQGAPLVLKRETTATDAEGKVKSYDATVEVLAMDMPRKVLTEIKPTSHVRTVHRAVDGKTTVTLEVFCSQVPGGLVAHTAKQIGETGLVVERSTLELLDYETVARPTSTRPAARRRLLKRHRTREKQGRSGF